MFEMREIKCKECRFIIGYSDADYAPLILCKACARHTAMSDSGDMPRIMSPTAKAKPYWPCESLATVLRSATVTIVWSCRLRPRPVTRLHPDT